MAFFNRKAQRHEPGDGVAPDAAVHPALDADALMRRLVGEIYERECQRLVELVRRIVGDPETAEDVVEDFFAKVLANPEDFRPEQFSPKVLRITLTNKAKDRLKREHRVVHLSDAVFAEIPILSSRYPDAQIEADVLRALVLNALKEPCRSVYLWAIEDYSHKEIAERLDMSERKVRFLLGDAVAVVRDVCAQVGYTIPPRRTRKVAPATAEASDE